MISNCIFCHITKRKLLLVDLRVVYCHMFSMPSSSLTFNLRNCNKALFKYSSKINHTKFFTIIKTTTTTTIMQQQQSDERTKQYLDNGYEVDFNPTTGFVKIYLHQNDTNSTSTSHATKNNIETHDDIVTTNSPTKGLQSFISSTPIINNNTTIPETVLQYERQKRKIEASKRATQPLNIQQHLKIIYHDPHIIVCNKPSGVLSVPGIYSNPSLLQLVYDTFPPTTTTTSSNFSPSISQSYNNPSSNDDCLIEKEDQDDHSKTTLLEQQQVQQQQQTTVHELQNKESKASYKDSNTSSSQKNLTSSNTPTNTPTTTSMISMEQMIVHRLDMDTSGIILYAKTIPAMQKLHTLFREHTIQTTNNHRRSKQKQQKLNSNIHPSSSLSSSSSTTTTTQTYNNKPVQKTYTALLCGHINPCIQNGEINLPLQKDHQYPPFMRIATPQSENEARQVVQDLQHAGWKKIMKKNSKPSITLFRVVEREWLYSNYYSSCSNRNGGCSANDDLSLTVGILDGTTKDNLNQNDAVRFDNQEQIHKKMKQNILSSSSSSSMEKLPVTRVELTPITGRTHQLRVHCAAIGHPIVADPAYGFMGEGNRNGGLEYFVHDGTIFDHIETSNNHNKTNHDDMGKEWIRNREILHAHRATTELEQKIHQYVEKNELCMCLHASELRIQHPITENDMVFHQPPSF